MKKINIALILSLIALTFGCNSNEWEAPGAEPSHQVVYSSEEDFENRIEVGGDISFGDVSRGITTRTWTIPESATIIGQDSKSSGSDIIHVVFNEVGMQEVKLSQTFSSNAYVGETQVGTQVDTTISVKVLEPISLGVTARYINKDGSAGDELNLSDNAENELMAGNSIRFFYTATGEPANLTYYLEAGDPEEVAYDETQIVDGSANETDIQYKRLGTYSMAVIAERERPFGADTVAIDNFIKVIASTEPVDLTGVYEKEGMMALDFSREMDPTSVDPTTFTVNIDNNGTLWSATVLNAIVDPNQGNIVLLELEDETLYNDDMVSVSYTPGALQTTDFMKSEAFENKMMIFLPSTNILEAAPFDHSFENSIDANWPYLWWGAPWDGYTLNVTNEDAHTGSTSAKITINQGQGAILGHRDAADFNTAITFTAEAGKNYEIGVWVKVESTGIIDDTAGEIPNLIFFFNPGTDWSTGRFDFTSQTPIGEWVYARMTFQTFPETGDYEMWLRGNNPANSGDLTFFMDDFTISEVNLRP